MTAYEIERAEYLHWMDGCYLSPEEWESMELLTQSDNQLRLALLKKGKE